MLKKYRDLRPNFTDEIQNINDNWNFYLYKFILF
jgi:hypothetical protein